MGASSNVVGRTLEHKWHIFPSFLFLGAQVAYYASTTHNTLATTQNTLATTLATTQNTPVTALATT